MEFYMNLYMEIAKNEAQLGVSKEDGGPFGAVITDKYGDIIVSSHNFVLVNKDPTAHAEIVAIRSACKKLDTYDLSNCILYTSCEPCPMCLSAIIWANIKEVYFSCTRKDAAKIGFRDDFIYEYLKGIENNAIHLHCIDHDECIKVFDEYQKDNKTIY